MKRYMKLTRMSMRPRSLFTLSQTSKPLSSVRCCSKPANTMMLSTHTEEAGKRVRKAYDGLLLDAGGTLLQLSKPVEQTYASIGSKYGVATSASEIKQGFKRAFAAPWTERLRYKEVSESIDIISIAVGGCTCEGDGKPFWKHVVAEATGCADEDYFEEVYQYYANGNAWHLPEETSETLSLLKDAGVKLAVVSNFDTRLRKLLKDLDVIDLFDAVVISSEVGHEKPDPAIFKAALDQIKVEANRAIHIGDDQKADKDGAAAVGICCWLWGKDVKTFSDIRSRILVLD